MIKSFGDKTTEDIYHGRRSKRARAISMDVRRAAIRKLDMIRSAHKLAELRFPPGNRLKALGGKWSGHHSIRVNDQWRVVFRWVNDQAHNVQIIDYHRG